MQINIKDLALKISTLQMQNIHNLDTSERNISVAIRSTILLDRIGHWDFQTLFVKT